MLPGVVAVRAKPGQPVKVVRRDNGKYIIGILKAPAHVGSVYPINAHFGDKFSSTKFESFTYRDPPTDIVPVTLDELLSGVQEVIDKYEPLIAQGGLKGAHEARRQFILQQVYNKLSAAKGNEGRLAVIESDNRIPAPGTGLYVMIDREHGKPLFGVRATPRHDEDTIAKAMTALLYKDECLPTVEASEVPERALDFVENPRKLTLELVD
ncbi:MAG: hypothetical protein ABIG30_01765 [Candidatus Aenigmatarchaeota archaeon]